MSIGNVSSRPKVSREYVKIEGVSVVKAYFENNFDGCTLTELSYEERDLFEASKEWAIQYKEEEAIVLKSSFKVGQNVEKQGLNSNTTYEEWKWILTRTDKGAWKLQTWGY